MFLLWDEWNKEHIAEHSVAPEEAADVVERAARPFPRRIAENEFLVRSQTSGGRYLQVIYVRREPDTIDPMDLALEDRVALKRAKTPDT